MFYFRREGGAFSTQHIRSFTTGAETHLQMNTTSIALLASVAFRWNFIISHKYWGETRNINLSQIKSFAMFHIIKPQMDPFRASGMS